MRDGPHRLGRVRSEDGSAVIEFVMMSVLLVFLLFAVLQLAVYLYVRTIVGAATADGARFGANADVDPRAGGDRARAVLDKGLSAVDAGAITCRGTAGVDAASGLAVTTVRCSGAFGLLFIPLHRALPIDMSSSALREGAG
jgi:Flp pilus assembly protein TadG